MRQAPLVWLFAAVALLPSARLAQAQRGFTETDLVSDIPGRAPVTDPDLKNAWGLVPGGQGTFWVSDNHSGRSTLYRPDGTKVNLVVSIPGGANTGIAVSGPEHPFLFASGDSMARAIFIFVSEIGTISAWNNNVNLNNAIQVASTPDAI